MTLKEAVIILEVNDLNRLTPKELKKLKREAFKRWHPDKIASLNLGQEKEKIYKENFQKIEGAVKTLEAFISGDIEQSQGHSQQKTQYKKSNLDILVEEYPRMVSFLRQNWHHIVLNEYKKTEEKKTVFEGISVKEALNRDLQADVPFISLLTLLTGCFIPLFVGYLMAELWHVFLYFTWIFIGLQVTSSLILLIPMSRFWLPKSIEDVMLYFINFSQKTFQFLMNFFNGFGVVGAIFFLILSLVMFICRFIQNYIFRPIYNIVGEKYKDRTIGKVVRNYTYYGGYTDKYVRKLINTPQVLLKPNQYYDIGNLYSRLGDFRIEEKSSEN